MANQPQAENSFRQEEEGGASAMTRQMELRPRSSNEHRMPADTFNKLSSCSAKKTGFAAGGQEPVDCGTTAIATYKAGAGFGGTPFTGLPLSKDPGGRREWNNYKHEHCSTGISDEATP